MPLSYKHIFPRTSQVAYLDTSAEGLPLPSCADAFQAYCRDKADGTPGRKAFHRVESEALDLTAKLLGTETGNVTFLSSASEALNALATSLEWAPGDEVVISDLEFPSNVLPWLRLKQAGIKVIVLPAEGGALHWEQVVEHIGVRTRLVSLSLVSYRTGAYLPDVSGIAAETSRVGAVLSIDATQALGRCPVSLDGVDYLVSSSFKWLLGPHGLGLVYVSPAFRKRMRPSGVGWYSVSNVFTPDRFECYDLKPGAACLATGMPNFPSIYALRESLGFLLQVGVTNIFAELRPLVERLRQGFVDLGCHMLTPPGAEYASGVVAFAHPEAERIGAVLAEHGVIVWGGDRRVRASVHLYNDAADIERCLTALQSAPGIPELSHV